MYFLIFSDFGWANQFKPTTPNFKNEYLTSVGTGVRYIIDDYSQIRADLGYRLTSVVAQNAPGIRFHFMASISF